MSETNANRAPGHRLLQALVAGVVAGILCGWYFGPAMTSVAWIGTLFLNALKMMIVPLIVAAMVSGVTALGDVRKLGRAGGYTLAYFALTTGLATVIGIVLVNVVEPGIGFPTATEGVPAHIAEREPLGVTDIVLSMVHPNLVGAAADMQLLPLILFAVAFGLACSILGAPARPVAQFFESLNEVMMKLVTWLMYAAPVGIFALVAAQVGRSGGGDGLMLLLQSVAMWVGTVIAGLGLQFALLFALLVLLGGRGWPYLVGMARALLTAFGTASSSATLPLTLECAREQGIDERALRITIPLGATINMNGTALYEGAAVLFIAQAYGVDLSLAEQAIVFLTATLAAIGAAGIPEAGLVTMVMVLTAVGLPVEGIGLLLAVDWFLDRFRTSVNVWGDCVGAALLDRRMDAPDRRY